MCKYLGKSKEKKPFIKLYIAYDLPRLFYLALVMVKEVVGVVRLRLCSLP
jgi:hypothetical protein